MNSEIEGHDEISAGFFVNLDGLKLEQLDQQYLGSYRAFEHQVKTERSIKHDDSFFLFNHSPTGSGKTISWLKPVLDMNMKVIAVYPTNALVIDQKKQVERTISKFGYDPEDYHVQAVTSGLLEAEKKLYPDESGLRKGQLLNRIIRKGRGKGLILLTNPDILTLALKDAYYEHNIREAVRSVDMVVVDEFHLASIKQSDMLLFMMHEIHDDIRSRLSKFVFLSATPNNDIVQRAKDVGLRVHVLEDKSSQSSFSEGWPVLPKLNIEVRSGSIYKTYELIKEDIDYFIEFCRRPTQEGNSAKTVFILDGIYEVDEIFNILSENLPDLNIERVDGLHHVTAQKLDNFDVLVSNSSVEVGIDFDVDRLVFSGYSKSKFLQRIGRLRNKPEDMVCDALCFVPENVYGHLKGEKKDLTRQELVTHLDRVMESSVNLSSYSKIYSPLEAYLYCKSRVEGEPWTDKNGNEHHFKGMPYSIQKEESLRILGLIEKHFLDQEINLQVVDHLKTESYSMKEGLLTYRGSGLQVLMFDTTDSMLKTYDLMYVLRRGKVEFMSPQRFIRRLRKETGENYESLRARYESMKAFASGFCWYNGTMNDETRKVILKGESGSHYSKLMFKSTDHVRKPRLVSGFKVETEPTIPTLSNLNDTLSQFNVFARLVDQDGFSLKAKFRLGDFFYLYPYYGMRSVAFGHEALYIDCLIKEEYKNRR